MLPPGSYATVLLEELLGRLPDDTDPLREYPPAPDEEAPQ
jgi:tRNA(Glu) U13 pseudouridine synthase TruD